MTAAIVFDLDDTLVDTFSVAQAKGRLVAEHLGLSPPSAREFAESYGSADFATCVRQWHPNIDVALYSQSYDDMAALGQPRTLCTIAPVLAAARDHGYAVGILTNGPARKTARKLAALETTIDDFAFVLHGDDGLPPKPHVAAFHRLRAEGLDLSTSWYVSDSPTDWKAAQAAGMGVVGTPRPWVSTSRVPYPAPHVTVRTVDDLVDVIPYLPSAPVSPTLPVAAISIDAGFTLIEPVLEPADVVVAAVTQRGALLGTADVAAVMERQKVLLADGAGIWASDEAASSALTRYYVAVLNDLGVADRGEDEWVVDLAHEVIHGYVAPSNWAPRPFARKLLELAGTGDRRVGVLSNWQSSLAEALAHSELLDLADVVLASSQVGAGKPAVTPFLAMAEALRVAPPAMAHIGDAAEADVAGGLRAGCPVIYAPPDCTWLQVASMLDAIT